MRHTLWLFLLLLAACDTPIKGPGADSDACNGEPCDEVCDDGLDNDDDGSVDCDDPDCVGVCVEICDDFADNDGDGLTDCDDSDCGSFCDADSDGYLDVARGGDDCDDTNPDVNPDAIEVCNGYDDDCNGLADEDDPDLDRSSATVFYDDYDGDGFGNPNVQQGACSAPSGMVEDNTDCFDNDILVNPAAVEICNGHDDNCDGLSDDEDPALDLASATPWYADTDGDGYGDALVQALACEQPPGYVDNPDDCDDTDPMIHASGMWIEDLDGDGFGAGAAVGPAGCVPPGPNFVSDTTEVDCDDADPLIFPGQLEICEDGIDQDCDLQDQLCTAFLYTVRESDDTLQLFDTDNLVFHDIGPLGVTYDFGELAWDSSTGTMWMIDGRGTQSLHTVDLTTGAATVVGSHGIQDLFGLTFDTSTNTLYATGESPSGFYEMNVNTGAAIWIGNPGMGSDGLTYDPGRDQLVGLEAGGGDIFTIDRATGLPTILASNGFVDNCGLAYEPVNDLIWAMDWSGNVFVFDPQNNYSRTSALVGVGSHDGLTYVPGAQP